MDMGKFFLTLLLLTLTQPIFAKPITSEVRGFIIDVPEDWELKNPKFLLAGPSDIYLTEINPSNYSSGKSMSMVETITTSVLKEGLKYKEIGGRLPVVLKNSKGSQQMFVDAAGRQVVQLLVEKDGNFWQFLLQVPMDIWSSRSEELMSIMRSVEIYSPAK